MLILLPPSESKRPGGRGRSTLDLDRLRFPSLSDARRATAGALVALSRSDDATHAAKALAIPPTLVGELQTNVALCESPVMPAIDRYTGVLYDALDAATLPAEARRHLGRSVVIHSAVFGPVGALDRIPDYRMSAASRLPGIRLRELWAKEITSALRDEPGPLIDLRSESYAALGPLGDRGDAVFIRVVTEGDDGRRKALNHFNKHAKGLLVRAYALERPRVRSVAGFVDWARSAGFRTEYAGDREVLLVVD
ncbi:peroxide stress protein YaaA [Humibacter soli]